MSEPTTVLLADDHPGILAAVSKYLVSNGIDVVARAKDGREALRQIQATQPAIALLDIRMPGVSGLELTRLAARCSPGTAVILFSGYGSRGQVVEALDAGARGFLLKNLALAEVLRAVQVVSRGGTYIDSSLAVTLAVPEDAPDAHPSRPGRAATACQRRAVRGDRPGPLRLDRDGPQDHVQGQERARRRNGDRGRRRRAAPLADRLGGFGGMLLVAGVRWSFRGRGRRESR